MWLVLKKLLRRNLLHILLLITFFSLGWSFSVPEPDENNQTLLIIPVETIQTLKKFIYTVNLNIEDSSGKRIPYRIEPDPDTFFSYKSQLKPGKYKLTKLYAVAKPGFRVGKKKRLRIRNFDAFEFQLENGKVTIIDKKLLIQQPERITDSNWKNLTRGERKKKIKERNEKLRKERFRHVEMLELDDIFKEKLMNELKEVENFEKWKISKYRINLSTEIMEEPASDEDEDY